MSFSVKIVVILWICSALQTVLSMRKITWLNSQQPKTRGHVEHHRFTRQDWNISSCIHELFYYKLKWSSLWGLVLPKWAGYSYFGLGWQIKLKYLQSQIFFKCTTFDTNPKVMCPWELRNFHASWISLLKNSFQVFP